VVDSTNAASRHTAAQVAALKAAECERIYREKAAGGRDSWLRRMPQRRAKFYAILFSK